jgi:hypothetical protein
MKNQNRIQKNRNAARTSPQVQTHRNLQPPAVNGNSAPGKKSGTNDGIAYVPAGGANIAFFDQVEDGYIASVPISKKRLEFLKRRAAQSGCSAGYFFKCALVRALAELEGKRDVRNLAENINTAVVQENVLLELIENHLDWREHRSGIDFTGEMADRFNFGLTLLIENTRSRLEKAAKEMMDAAYQNYELAS